MTSSTASHLSITPGDASKKFQEKMQSMALNLEQKKAKEAAILAGLPYIYLVGYVIPAETLSLLKQEDAEDNHVIVFDRTAQTISVASVDVPGPDQRPVQQALQNEYRVPVKWYLTDQTSYQSAMRLYAALPRTTDETAGVNVSAQDIQTFKQQVKDITTLSETLRRSNVTDVVSILIAGALETRSSDVHVEAEEKEIHIRYRIDGVLTDVAVLPKSSWNKIISRLKLLAGLKINVSDRPQDGRFSIFLKEPKESKVDVRVSMLPTNFGESVVMRLLGSSLVDEISFDSLGLQGRSYEELKHQLERPNGMVITTGPTGSGKTTTMYAALKMLNEPGVKIITIEDPIEYELTGVNQSQVSPESGYTFANGLRSIVRQDPDIILVGEIRDLETAEIAIQAALTGHLVLSTVHTNSAAGTIPRLLSMGTKAFLLTPALNAMIGQRLVRRLCEACKKPIELPAETKERVEKILDAISPAAKVTLDRKSIVWNDAKGCNECNGIGYKGRVGIYEILVMNKEIEKLVLSGQVSEYQMEEVAVANGMVTMVQDGLLKAAAGQTSVAEVFRIVE